MFLAAKLSLYFGLKAVIVLVCAAEMQAKAGSRLMAAALAWVGLQLCLIGLLLVLSPFAAVNGAAVWLFLTATLALLTSRSLVLSPSQEDAENPWALAAISLAVVTVFGALFYRSLYFFDTTWDALVYELPRLAFYTQARSLLITYPTLSLNIFANEWNGELLSLAARLAGGSDQALGFGGAEIWLWGWVALAAAAHRLGARPLYAGVVSLLLMTSPAVLGLSMVVKGDLLATFALALGVACLLPAGAGEERFLTGSAVVMFAFAAGAKITVLPVATLLSLYAGFRLLRCSVALRWLLLLALMIVIGGARYVLNVFVYHNPVERIAAEQAMPGLTTLWSNITGVMKKILDVTSWPWHVGERWVLAFGFGATGWLVVSAILGYSFVRWKYGKQLGTRKPALLILILGLGWLYVAYNVPWRPWSLRYHLPWLVLGALVMLTSGSRRIPARVDTAAVVGCLAATALQAVYPFGRGEVNPTSFAEARGHTQLARKLAFHPYMVNPDLQELATSPPMTIAIFNQVDSAILPFFGDNSRHQVRLVAVPKALIGIARQATAEVIVLAGNRTDKYVGPVTKIQAAGFHLIMENEFFTVLRREQSHTAIDVK